jgi:hypothetical protein
MRLEKDFLGIHPHRDDLHVQLLAAPGEPAAHRGKRFDALYPLDTILENDILMIVREMCDQSGFPSVL